MAAKQAPSKVEKTPKHCRKNRPATKAPQKNRESTAKKPPSHETTTEKTVRAQSSNPVQPPKLRKPPTLIRQEPLFRKTLCHHQVIPLLWKTWLLKKEMKQLLARLYQRTIEQS
jgi:hypothetical protein